jgi:hypothetical protein
VLVIILMVNRQEGHVKCAALRLQEKLLLKLPRCIGPFTEPGRCPKQRIDWIFLIPTF